MALCDKHIKTFIEDNKKVFSFWKEQFDLGEKQKHVLLLCLIDFELSWVTTRRLWTISP